jgi:hypothetical protein
LLQDGIEFLSIRLPELATRDLEHFDVGRLGALVYGTDARHGCGSDHDSAGGTGLSDRFSSVPASRRSEREKNE